MSLSEENRKKYFLPFSIQVSDVCSQQMNEKRLEKKRRSDLKTWVMMKRARKKKKEKKKKRQQNEEEECFKWNESWLTFVIGGEGRRTFIHS